MNAPRFKSMFPLKRNQLGPAEKLIKFPLKSWSKFFSWSLIVGGIISLPLFFTSQLKKQKHLFENDYRQDLQAPFRSIQVLEANKNYVFFQIRSKPQTPAASSSISSTGGSEDTVLAFKIETAIGAQPVSVDQNYTSVTLHQGGRIEQSLARFSVDRSGPYVISAATNNGDLERLTMRSESPLEKSVKNYSQFMLIGIFMIAFGVLLRFPMTVYSLKGNFFWYRRARNRTHSLPRVHPMSKSRA